MIAALSYGAEPVKEWRLLAMNIFSTLLLISLVACGIAGFFLFFSKDDIKKRRELKERLRKLEAVVENNETAQNNLEKSKNRLKSKLRKFGKEKLPERCVFFATLIITVFLDLYILVVPGWLDYSRKDYVEYEGSFEYVQRQMRKHSSISYLADGTKVSGGLELDDGEYYGTIVYSKRTKIVIGYSISDD